MTTLTVCDFCRNRLLASDRSFELNERNDVLAYGQEPPATLHFCSLKHLMAYASERMVP